MLWEKGICFHDYGIWSVVSYFSNTWVLGMKVMRQWIVRGQGQARSWG